MEEGFQRPEQINIGGSCPYEYVNISERNYARIVELVEVDNK